MRAGQVRAFTSDRHPGSNTRSSGRQELKSPPSRIGSDGSSRSTISLTLSILAIRAVTQVRAVHRQHVEGAVAVFERRDDERALDLLAREAPE